MSSQPDPIWAVVPIKCFSSAKGRLAPILAPPIRARLARAMAEDVLLALREAKVARRLCVLSDAASVGVFAAQNGAHWLDERRFSGAPGLNAGIQGAAKAAQTAGAALLVVHADLPLLTADAIRQVADAWRALTGEQRVVLARSCDGGTNILLAERPAAFTFRYGAGSHALHHDECVRRQRAVATVELPGTALDIDSSSDFERLKQAARAGRCGPRTAALLGELADVRFFNLIEATP